MGFVAQFAERVGVDYKLAAPIPAGTVVTEHPSYA